MAKDENVEFPSEKNLDSKKKSQPHKPKQATESNQQKPVKNPVEAKVLKETKADLDELLHDDSEAQVKQDKALMDLKQQNAELEDRYLRAEAEIRNMTNRHKKETASILKYDGQNLAKDILPVLDNLERALAVEVSDDNGNQLKKGIEMVYQGMQKALQDNHITEIKAQGQKFDPNLHQAVQTVPKQAGQAADTVVQVLQRGYLLQDRILRPAMVVVAQ